jgi:hypothetical protein
MHVAMANDTSGGLNLNLSSVDVEEVMWTPGPAGSGATPGLPGRCRLSITVKMENLRRQNL